MELLLRTHDSVGKLLSKTDRKNQTIQYVYDALNRLSHKGLSGFDRGGLCVRPGGQDPAGERSHGHVRLCLLDVIPCFRSRKNRTTFVYSISGLNQDGGERRKVRKSSPRADQLFPSTSLN